MFAKVFKLCYELIITDFKCTSRHVGPNLQKPATYLGQIY